jgi:protein tyrosine/serine phosphatase
VIKNEGNSSEFPDATYLRFQMGDYFGRFLKVSANGLDCNGSGYHKWAVTEVTNGNMVLKCIYQPSQVAYATQGYYVAIDKNGELVLVDSLQNAAVWQFVDAATQKSIVAAAAKTRLAAIASKAGITVTNDGDMENAIAAMSTMDMTGKVDNPTMFENMSGWTVNKIQGADFNNGEYRIQVASGVQSMVTQTVTGLPAGLYTVSIQAFYRASAQDSCVVYGTAGYTFSNAYFMANDNEVLIKDWYSISTDNHTKPTSRSHIKDGFDDDPKYTNTVCTYVGDDGKLDLTIAVPSYAAGNYPNWFCFNNVKLTYYYNPGDLSVYEALLAAAVDRANAVGTLPTQAAEDFQAVLTANNKVYTTSDDYQAAIDAIEAATTQAQAVATEYAGYLAIRHDVDAVSTQDVYTDNNGAESAFNTEVSSVESAVQTATLAEAATTIPTQKAVLWNALLTFMKSVTINDGMGFDLTSMIKDADFSDENYKNYWTETLTTSNIGGVKNGVLRYYNCAFDLAQTLPYKLPAGAYRMKADGCERTDSPLDTAWSDYQDGGSVVTGTLYLNDNELLVMDLFDVQSVTDNSLGGENPAGATFYVPIDAGSADKYFAGGYYQNTLIGVLPDDGTVTIGYRCLNAKAWTCVDNFRLEYIGEVPQVALPVNAGEQVAVCAPFTLRVSDTGVEALYTVGGVQASTAKVYPVATVAAGTPCVAKFTIDNYSAPMEKTLSNGRKFDMPWYEGCLKNDATNSTWSYVDKDNRETTGASLAFDVLDYDNMEFAVNLENSAARKYLNDVTYSGSGDASQVTKYNVAPPDRRDIPNAVMIPVPAFSGNDATLVVKDDDGQVVETQTVTPGQAEAYVYNLTPQQTYTYTIVPGASPSGTLSKGTFTTDGHLRMIYAPSAYNIRDLGGWLTDDGHRTTYGHLYRGSTLNGYVTATPEDLQRLRELGIEGEIDLRWKESWDKDMGCGVSAFGFTGDDYYFAAANDNNAECLSSSETQGRLKAEFDFIIDHFKNDKAVYFHCAWGADRTGILAFLLEGVLGVTLDQIYKDYELTTFSAAPGSSSRLKTNFQATIDVIQNLSGATLRDKFENYFVDNLGVTRADIVFFRSVMLGVSPTIIYDKGEEAAGNTARIADLAANNNGQGTTTDIILQGRTLWKDGNWNTLCLPFSMTAEQVTAQLAPSRLMTLDTENKWSMVNGQWSISESGHATGIDNGTLYLQFQDANTITAGVPCLIKWSNAEPNNAEATEWKDPVFTGITVSASTPVPVSFNGGQFVGTYNYLPFTQTNTSILLLGTGNTLYNPTDGDRIGACRAYFDLGSSNVREFRLNFVEGEANGITSHPSSLTSHSSNLKSQGWYTLDGCKLEDKPTKKGLYIHNGRKVTVTVNSTVPIH